ncbi:Hydroxymethylpyrimidine/phosphomethylpyrimidine kinase [bioreactor metagenome]|uniref:Hydroxymethylpyrimidine/phosphomethylpyrimidine kinase n=1 Tax=bioreactor metagenome TaxID=1076179 RepID=A0A644YPT1_9ZZZZ
MKKVLTVAGSDCSGGAGIQADIKTITAHKMYAMSAITALTAQNTTGVYDILEAAPQFVGRQLDCVFSDIRPDSVKVGMVSSVPIIEKIVEKLGEYGAENLVVDPVMVSTSGCRLLSEEAQGALVDRLLPLAAVITPNIPEAEVLCGFPIRSEADMLRAAEVIAGRLPVAVLIKGGHGVGDANDLLFERGRVRWFRALRVDNPNTHGTGCTLSAAIACNLAAGYSLEESIQRAKDYLTGALKAMLDLGRGSGPLDHTYAVGLDA